MNIGGCECNHNYLSAYYDDNDNVRHLIDGYEPITQTNLAIEYMEQQSKSERPWALWLCFSTLIRRIWPCPRVRPRDI